ncbi:MAG: DUF6089 family protein [Balneolaceae bacterium]|nr:DUF6089 family protein [Balneolaceae bacterium]
MQKRIPLFLFLFFFLIGTINVQAQTEEQPWSVQVGIGSHSYDGDLGNEMFETSGSDFLWTLGVSHYLSPSFDVGLSASKMKLDYINDMDHNVVAKRGTQFQTDNFGINLEGRFKLNNGAILNEDAAIKPYLSAGVGVNILKHDYGDSENVFGIPVGGGLSYKISESILLNYDFTYNRLFSDGVDGYPSDPGEVAEAPTGRPALDNSDHDDFLTHTVGIVFSFGGGDKMSREEKLFQQTSENVEASRQAAREAQKAAESAQQLNQESKELNQQTQEALSELREERSQSAKRSGMLAEKLLNVINNIEFEYNASEVAENSYDDLNMLAQIMNDYSGLEVRVEGHADERGSSDYNMNLSEQRAEAVKDFLVKEGVNESRITTEAYGETRPDMKGNSETAYAQNRYVELVFNYNDSR